VTGIRLEADFERFKRALPRDFPAYVRDAYGIDLEARYLGCPLPHPLGKASGQLSLNLGQLEEDAAAGLAFVVLKTVIAQDATGAQSMAAWAIKESRMRVERRAARDGRPGWTVTWKGRGWDRSFEAYLDLVRAGADLAQAVGMPIVPSVKFHLPPLGEPFREAEYRYTTGGLAEASQRVPLLLEVDFSPTLAGDALSDERAAVLRWVREVPRLVRAVAPGPVRVAVKLMNARFEDAFQIAMLDACDGADALVCFNRLYDSDRGTAYGGWDLSDRNLRVLDTWRRGPARVPVVGTGNVTSGRVLIEYAKRGCESVAAHTVFQLPLAQFPATHGSRAQRVLHSVIFHPTEGLVACMLELEGAGELARRDGLLHFLDVGRRAD
jgi:hypothetical protein